MSLINIYCSKKMYMKKYSWCKLFPRSLWDVERRRRFRKVFYYTRKYKIITIHLYFRRSHIYVSYTQKKTWNISRINSYGIESDKTDVFPCVWFNDVVKQFFYVKTSWISWKFSHIHSKHYIFCSLYWFFDEMLVKYGHFHQILCYKIKWWWLLKW